jgi:hypothetical protein
MLVKVIIGTSVDRTTGEDMGKVDIGKLKKKGRLGIVNE